MTQISSGRLIDQITDNVKFIFHIPNFFTISTMVLFDRALFIEKKFEIKLLKLVCSFFFQNAGIKSVKAYFGSFRDFFVICLTGY